MNPSRLLLCVAGSVTLFSAGATHAGNVTAAPPDEVVVAPAPVPVFSWGGGYAGLQAGYLSSSQSVNLNLPDGSTINEWNPDPDGATAGIFAGYNWETAGSLVFGVEAEYNWADASGTGTILRSITGGNTASENVDASIDATAAVRGRLGFALDRTLLYATAGWAWASYDGRVYGLFNGTPSGNTASWSSSVDGWTAGIGVERAFNDRWVGRIDYRYSDFGSLDYAPIGTSGANFSGDLTTSEIRLGAAMRF